MTLERFWLIVGGIATIATVVLGIFGFYFTHHEASKGIEAILISRSQLLNPELRKKPSELQLLFKNHEIPDVGILQIHIRNSGAQPITKADIEEPIRISVEGAKGIISAPVVETHPPNLPIETIYSGAKVELSKTLLNPDDALTVEIDAITAEGGKLDVSEISGRVAGVQHIDFHRSLPERAPTSSFFFWTGFLVGVVGAPLLAILTSTLWIILGMLRAMKRGGPLLGN